MDVSQLQNENQLLSTRVGFLQKEANVLSNKVVTLEEKLSHRDQEVKRLNHLLLLAKKSLYGTKAEVHIETESRQLVFNELEEEFSKSPSVPVEIETITYTRKKGRQKKKPFPGHLPRQEVIIDLTEGEKVCPHDGTALKEIGEDVVEKLKTVPAQSTIVVERTKKYACPCCATYMAQPSCKSILPKTIATPELLSFLIFSKFFQALPFYRLEELYKLQGIELSRGTMARWLIQVSEKLTPLWNVLEEKVLDSGYMCIDATGVQVLKEKGREPQAKSFMWARGSSEQNIVLFDYNVSGGGPVAEKLISGFKGAVQADAHGCYKILEKSQLTLLGCMMHARRYFYEAWLGGKKKPGVAETGVKMIKRIYRYEESYKGFSHQERYEARLKDVKPYLENMKEWAEKKKKLVLPKSPTGQAINYFLNNYEELSGFLKDGRYELDNGWVERAIRKFAIGRNNWLFSDTVAGAEASSLLYSLSLTAKLNNKDPFTVMADIFRKLPYAKTLEDYEQLTQCLLAVKSSNDSTSLSLSQ